jgi:hypothetical protein
VFTISVSLNNEAVIRRIRLNPLLHTQLVIVLDYESNSHHQGPIPQNLFAVIYSGKQYHPSVTLAGKGILFKWRSLGDCDFVLIIDKMDNIPLGLFIIN